MTEQELREITIKVIKEYTYSMEHAVRAVIYCRSASGLITHFDKLKVVLEVCDT